MSGSFCTVCRQRIPRGSRCKRHAIVSPSSRSWRGKAKVRAAVLARDQGCVVCGSRDRLEVHHLDPAAAGGETVPNRLVALCRAHHLAVEKGEITVTDPTNPTSRGPQIALHEPVFDREAPDGLV